MINNVISSIAIVIFIATFLRNKRKGIVAYCVFIIIMPVFIIDNTRLGFDIVAFPILFLFYIVSMNFRIKIKREVKGLFIYLIIYILLTIFASIRYDASFSFATTYAIFRFSFCILVIISIYTSSVEVLVDNVLSIVLPIELLFCVLQITNLVSVQIFYNLYFRESLIPLHGQLTMGYFNRSYGTTGSPLLIGGFSAIAFAFYLGIYLKQYRRFRYVAIKLLGCVLCGLLSLSKTAILAIPIITIFMMVFPKNNKIYFSRIIRNILFLVLVAFSIVAVINWLDRKGYAILYYVSFLQNPALAFNTRYGTSTGNLSGAMRIIGLHPIFGAGNSNFGNYFIGDSIYIVLLYETGIIGFFAYFAPFVKAFLQSLKKWDISKIAIILTFLLIGTGNAIQVSAYMIIFIAFSFDNTTKSEIKISNSRRLIN